MMVMLPDRGDFGSSPHDDSLFSAPVPARRTDAAELQGAA